MSTFGLLLLEWKFEKLLGSGAFGEVSQYSNTLTGQSVAIKRCSVNLDQIGLDVKKKLLTRWPQELQLMENLDNPNIVRVCRDQCRNLAEELNRTSNLPVIVMEYCDGGNLRQKLHNIENINGFSENDVRQVLTALKNAIFYLHNQCKVTHRDIKPDNIVIKIGSDGKPIYKLTDMGYARIIDHNTIAGSMVGSPNYFAPEIVELAEYKNTVDYWSMGIVAFEISCGVYPFLQDQNLYDVLNCIRQKPTNCIGITKSNDGRICYHECLFPENHLTKSFRTLIEPWLQLALNKDGRTRGYEGSVLKFYTKLDEALKAKIFTVYWLNRCKFLSYCIDKLSTMESLYSTIESDTGVRRSNFYFAFPVGHKLNCITTEVQPAQLYDPEFADTDRPMLYLIDFQTGELCNPEEPFISESMKEIFSTTEQLQPRILKKFMLNVLYVHRNEWKRIIECANGIHEYAMYLENEMMSQEELVKNFQTQILQYNGKAAQFETMVAMGKQFYEKHTTHSEFIDNQWEVIAHNFKNLFVELLNIVSHLKATLKKIREFMDETKKPPFVQYQENVELLVKQFEVIFEEVRDKSSLRSISDNDLRGHMSSLLRELYNFFENIKRWLQRSSSIDSIIGIHIEYRNIMNVVYENQELLKASESRIAQKTKEYLETFSKTSEKSVNIVERMDTLHLDNGQLLSSPSYSMDEHVNDIPTLELINDSKYYTQALKSFWNIGTTEK